VSLKEFTLYLLYFFKDIIFVLSLISMKNISIVC